MKKSFSFILLVFSLLLVKTSYGQCEKILAVKDVQIKSCGEVQFRYIIEKGTGGTIQFEWFIDNSFYTNQKDFTRKFSGKRWIPYTLYIWNKDCIGFDYKTADSIYIDYEPVSVMAAFNLDNCTEAKFNYISTDTQTNPPKIEWVGEGGFASSEPYPTYTYLGPGTYKYMLKYTAFPYTCQASYYSGVVVVKNTASARAGADKTICMYSGQQILSGIPDGGMWTGNGVDGNTFDPEKAGIGKHELLYTTHENACEAKDKLYIIVKDINPDFSSDVVEGTAPLTVNFAGQLQNNQSVSWDFGDANSQSLNSSVLPNPSHTYTEHGEYNVTFKIDDSETGCSGERIYKKMIRVSEKVQIVFPINNGLAIYPNPTRGEFKFVIEKPDNVNYNIDIISINGQLLASSGLMSLAKTDMNLSNLTSGLYIVKVNMDNGKTLTGKVVLLN